MTKKEKKTLIFSKGDKEEESEVFNEIGKLLEITCYWINSRYNLYTSNMQSKAVNIIFLGTLLLTYICSTKYKTKILSIFPTLFPYFISAAVA